MKAEEYTCGLESFVNCGDNRRWIDAFSFIPLYVAALVVVVLGCAFIPAQVKANSGAVVREYSAENGDDVSERPDVKPTAADGKVSDGRIEINSADEKLLGQLPGIGKEKARRIVETRNKLGGFRSVEDLLNVEGIGEKILENISGFIAVL